MSKVCVDNFGGEVHRSHFSSELVTTGIDLKLFPAIVPGVKASYTGRDDELPLWKESAQEFQRLDANCNTCIHLQRHKHPKDPLGFLYGECKQGQQTVYRSYENGIMFHPEDPMHQPCHEQRTLVGK
jgi:hypothetical protein